MTALEIAVTSLQGARDAARHGADRLEVCSALEVGGVTPSNALIEATTGAVPVHVLIRCRPGDFVYDRHELRLMEREIDEALMVGAEGVVVGALTDGGELDLEAMRRLVDAALFAVSDAEITVHRAIDHARDPVAAAAQLADLGVHRVLTSGGAASAGLGIATLRAMRGVLGDVELMAGGGVRPADVPALVAAGADAVHLSAKRRVAARTAGVALGSADDAAHFVTDPAVVAAARAKLDAIRN